MECHLYDPREYCLWNNRKEWHSDGSGDDTVMRAGTWATVMRAGMAQWWKHRPLHYWWEQGWQSNRSRDGTMMRAGMAQWWEKGWHSDECRDGTVMRAGTMANPCNPAMSPHAEKGSRSQSHWINGGKSGKGVGKTTWMMNCQSKPCCKLMLKARARMPQSESTWNSDMCAYAKTAEYYWSS